MQGGDALTGHMLPQTSASEYFNIYIVHEILT
jgi:hypothetical protein